MKLRNVPLSGDWMDWAIPIVVVILVCIGIGGCFASAYESERLYQECMADGHKEYECHGLRLGYGFNGSQR